MKSHSLKKVTIEKYCGYNINPKPYLATIKKSNYYIQNINVIGDAPKEFIKVYEFGKVRKNSRKNWIGYIAKTGQKWYPSESITEYLMNQIGETIGLEVAESKLAFIGGQLRFLSKYFLTKDESLVHASQIFAGYLSGDINFVDEVEIQNQARNLFTFQFAQNAIKEMFPSNFEIIIDSLVKLLIFDGIVGNNDRHIYNWGVITDVFGYRTPRFSPIFDTARGLFWNESEIKLQKLLKQPKELEVKFHTYAKGSRPKTGWEGHENINHFELIELLVNSNSRFKLFATNFCSNENRIKIQALLNSKFSNLFSIERIKIISNYIDLRFNKINEILNK